MAEQERNVRNPNTLVYPKAVDLTSENPSVRNAAWNQWVKNDNGFAFALAYRSTRDIEAAHDVVQDAWLAVHRGTINNGLQDGNLRGLVASSVQDRLVDKYRAQNKRVGERSYVQGEDGQDLDIIPEDFDSPVEAAVLARSEVVGITDAIHSSLPPEFADTFLGLVDGQYDKSGLAEEMGVAPGTVRSRESKAKAQLREVADTVVDPDVIDYHRGHLQDRRPSTPRTTRAIVSIRLNQILDSLSTKGVVSSRDIADTLGMSVKQARTYLQELEGTGKVEKIVEPDGKSRYTKREQSPDEVATTEQRPPDRTVAQQRVQDSRVSEVTELLSTTPALDKRGIAAALGVSVTTTEKILTTMQKQDLLAVVEIRDDGSYRYANVEQGTREEEIDDPASGATLLVDFTLQDTALDGDEAFAYDTTAEEDTQEHTQTETAEYTAAHDPHRRGYEDY